MSSQTKQPTIRVSQSRKELLASYANAAACLYGALSIEEFVDIFNHYESEETYEQEALLGLQRYAKASSSIIEYSIYEGLIAGPTIHPEEFEDDEDEIYALRDEQQGKPHFLPETKEEFLKFANPLYIEPRKPYDDLKAYIIKHKLADNAKRRNAFSVDDIDSDIINLYDFIQDRVAPAGLIQYFVERGYELDNIDVMNNFMQVVMEAHNNTRLFENNGHTPHELMEMHRAGQPKEPVFHIQKKVGRNESCPCGSGKKFKRCCALVEI